VVRASRADVAAKKETIVVSEVTSSFTKYLSGLSEDINNVKNPLQLAKLITSRLSEASDGLKSIAKSKYDQTAKELEDLKTSLGKLTDETVDKSISLLEGKLTKTITSIEEMIKTEMKTRDEELKNLNEAKSKMSELINDQTALNSIDRDIKRTTNYYKTSIVTLEKLTTTLKTQRDNLTRLRSEGISDKTQLVTRVRSEITQTLTKVKDLLDTYRRKEDALSV
jgi:chromosome segregation ATPase